MTTVAATIFPILQDLPEHLVLLVLFVADDKQPLFKAIDRVRCLRGAQPREGRLCREGLHLSVHLVIRLCFYPLCFLRSALGRDAVGRRGQCGGTWKASSEQVLELLQLAAQLVVAPQDGLVLDAHYVFILIIIR